MLSFIRKRIPAKERNNEHQIAKDDEHLRKFKSEEKMRKTSLSTISELVIGPSTSTRINQINQSYSDVDYFPMRSGCLAETVNDEKLTSSHDSLSDCYFNPSENNEAKNEVQHVQPTVIKSLIIDIPIIVIQKDCEETKDKTS